jgi:SAM-dependent methyltransferase
VDYLTRPVEVFRDVGRVLKPGGLFLITFSNRFFPQKVVKIWRESGEAERVGLVTGFFEATGLFDPPALFVSKGRPRPENDTHADSGLPSDPVYAVYAERKGGHGAPRPLPTGNDQFPIPDPELVRERKAKVGESLRCPHCDQQLDMWRVPHTPFTQWSSEYQYLCFNDECPYFVRGWGALISQGIPGSYRFMFDPDSGTCHSAPVLTPQSLRESIVSG